jgi:hypothetical protein
VVVHCPGASGFGGVNALRRPDAPGWTQVDQLVASLRRQWNTGSYLKRYLAGEPWHAVELPVKGPTAAELQDHLDQARRWLERFEQQAGTFQVEYEVVQSSLLGANRVPSRVRIESFVQLCEILGTQSDVETIEEMRAHTRVAIPVLASWVSAHPLAALRHASVWEQVLATVQWIIGHDTGRLYVRQIDVAGVDTKFVERHHRLLEQLLTILLPSYRFNPEAFGFAARFRFLDKPSYIRFRVLDPTAFSAEFSEMTVRMDELAKGRPKATTVFVVENEVTYLAFPPVPNALVVFGSGILTGLADLPWLRLKELVYWGDIDTHGFNILDGLRSRFDSVRSILMDRDTLMAHPQQWETETNPTSRPLPHLTTEEESLYKDLIGGTYGESVRLEQERIRFSIVEETLEPWRHPMDST